VVFTILGFTTLIFTGQFCTKKKYAEFYKNLTYGLVADSMSQTNERMGFGLKKVLFYDVLCQEALNNNRQVFSFLV